MDEIEEIRKRHEATEKRRYQQGLHVPAPSQVHIDRGVLLGRIAQLEQELDYEEAEKRIDELEELMRDQLSYLMSAREALSGKVEGDEA